MYVCGFIVEGPVELKKAIKTAAVPGLKSGLKGCRINILTTIYVLLKSAPDGQLKPLSMLTKPFFIS